MRAHSLRVGGTCHLHQPCSFSAEERRMTSGLRDIIPLVEVGLASRSGAGRRRRDARPIRLGRGGAHLARGAGPGGAGAASR